LSATPQLVPVETRDRESFMEMAEEHFRELNPDFKPAPDWKSGYFENIRRNRDYSLRWIVAGGERMGFLLFGVENHRFLPRKTGAIYELYVIPGQRRKGIARACAQLVVQELWKLSPSKIQLEVVEGNLAAAALWKSLGFQKASERMVLSERSAIKLAKEQDSAK
jgi:ribosomal protein S18 acetylase RimI-like enzyme